MPLLGISIPQSSFRNNPYSIGFQKLHHVSFLSTGSRWRYFHNPVSGQLNRGGLIIRAVATLEPRATDKKIVNVPVNDDIDNDIDNDKDKAPVQDDKELLRRNRISKANKGKEAWNKGVKHSPETVAKIRERTRLAMQSPQERIFRFAVWIRYTCELGMGLVPYPYSYGRTSTEFEQNWVLPNTVTNKLVWYRYGYFSTVPVLVPFYFIF
ncbi:putative nuclease associated modular domain 3 [Helianthus annuus]|nr:putative nuclease associated modular domain 3 [Helianthus annuus]